MGRGETTLRLIAVASVALAVGLPGVPRPVAPVDPTLADEALVSVAHGQSDRVAEYARRAGAQDVRSLPGLDLVTAHVDAVATRALATNVSVRFIAADAQIAASDLRQTDTLPPTLPGGVNVAPLFSQFQTLGASTTVAIVDSGVADSPDLAGRIAARVDFVNDGATASDPGGHGTFVAGLIAGSVTGVDPRAKIVSLRVLDQSGSGSARTALAAFDWLLRNRVDYGIRVVNLSWGAPQRSSYTSDVLAAAAESLWFSGMIVVAAAGNHGPAAGTIDTPAADPFVIAVGSLSPDDGQSEWSSRGPTLDGFAKPDVLALGEQIVSLRVPGSLLDRLYERESTLGSSYATASGTSAATAVVSGMAALLVEKNPAYTPTVVKTALVSTARPAGGSSAPELVASSAFAFSPSGVTTLANAGLRPSGLLLQMVSPSLNGSNITWENVTWETITWETITWETITWETVTWETLTWETVSGQR